MYPAPPTEPTPIAVVGGGPAGLATAIALALAGQQVVVLERGSWPRDKVCGEGVMPSGVAVLERLGVLPMLEPDQYRPFVGIGWMDVYGCGVDGDFATGHGLAIRRTGLSAALVRRAKTLENIQLWERAHVKDMTLQSDGMLLTITRGGEVRHLLAEVVIGADGRNSPVRRRSGLQGPPPVQARRWGARQHFSIAPWSDRVEVWWADGVEAYVTPSSDSRVEVALLWDEAAFEPSVKGPDLVAGMLTRFPQLHARLAGVLDKPSSTAAAVGPLAVAARCAFADRILLVGDAVGYVDGITGEGITAGLLQAEAIAETLPQKLQEGKLDAAGLRSIGARVQNIFHETIPLARAALLLSRHRSLRTLVFRGLSRASGLFTHLLELNMGRTSWYRVRPSQLLHFAIGLVRPSGQPSTSVRLASESL